MFDRQSFRQTLIEILEADLGEHFASLEDGKLLRDDLGLDSIDVINIAAQVEHRCGIELSQQELDGLTTVGQLLDLLMTRLPSFADIRSLAA